MSSASEQSEYSSSYEEDTSEFDHDDDDDDDEHNLDATSEQQLVKPVAVDEWQMEAGGTRPYLTEDEAALTKVASLSELIVHPVAVRRRSMAAAAVLDVKQVSKPDEELTKAQPKLLFANERTLTQWLNNSFLISVRFFFFVLLLLHRFGVFVH
jgi:hypothetical protein